MNNFPLVSVIIPSHPKHTEMRFKTVENIMQQTYPCFEIIVETGGSDRINAKNIGIQKSNGVFVAFCDDDDTWDSKKLEYQMNLMNNNPDVGIVICWSADGRRGVTEADLKPKPEIFYKDLLRGWCISATSSFLVRKSFLVKIGGFDESLRGSEEYDLALRFLKSGYRVCCVQNVLMTYSANSMGSNVSCNYGTRIRAFFDLYRKWGWEMWRSGVCNTLFRVFYNFGWNLLGIVFPNVIIRVSFKKIRGGCKT